MDRIKIIFIYKGDGLGIPGLPHEVSRERAQELGLLFQLEAAIQNGAYKPASPPETGTVKTQTRSKHQAKEA